ncbi:MAG TPA: vWA domain-containing protein [Ktedonobacterales bacterium]
MRMGTTRRPGPRGAGLAMPLMAVLAMPALLLAVLGGAIASVPSAHAAPLAVHEAHPAHPAANTPSGHVTILVLDMSGSMGNPGQGGNDPAGLRCSAAHAYIDLSGVGQWVGLVGLAHPDGAPGDATTAQDYAQPAEMTTDAARAAMRKALDVHSNHCAGNGTTPMADALARADRMLHAATQGGALTGSVILLTDGLPDPDASGQITALHHLLPDFQSNDWPIDTIALGGADRGFLRGISDTTGGTAYDVAHGPVPGVSPLNLEPFFVDIFRVNAGRTLVHAVPPLALAGPATRQFHVGRFIAHMDVLVVRDSPNVAVQLYAPGNYPNSPVLPGQAAVVASDPHYTIYSITTPVRGDWVLAFSGSGQLLTDALMQSTLSLQLVSPRANQHLPLGQPLTLDAALRDGSDQVLAEPVTVTASLAPANGANRTGREVPLADQGGASPTGNYQGRVTIPTASPRGTYHVTLGAQLNDAFVSLVVPVVLEPFPVPTLLAPSDGTPRLAGFSVDAVPGGPLAVSFGLTVDGKLQAEPHVGAALTAAGQPVSLSTLAGTWQGLYVPARAGAQPLVVRLTGTYHGTDLAPWTYALPLTVALRPTLGVSGVDTRRPYPAHRTLSATVAYFRQAGVPDPRAAGHITAILLPPNGIGAPLALQPALEPNGQPQPGAYTLALPFGTPGTYTLHVTFDDGVASDHSERLFVLRVVDFPAAVAAGMPSGEHLTNWGPVLGGIYGLPIVNWLEGLPLAGTPNQPTGVVTGRLLLAGQPYTGGTLSAVAYTDGRGHPIPAEVSRDGASFTARFHPPAGGAYHVVVTWTGDFAGLRADQEPTAVPLELSIVAPNAGGWARATLFTLIYLALLLALVQLGVFGATPAPAGALQAAGNPDDLYYVDRHRGSLLRRYLHRNRVRTADLGLPAGAELRFRRHRTPVVVADGTAGGSEVVVGGTALRPGAAPIALADGTITFRQADLDLGDLDGFDDRDDPDAGARAGSARARARRADRARDRAEGLGSSLSSSYIYVAPGELRERLERDDPFAGLAAAAEDAGDPFAEAPARPRSVLGQVGALAGLFVPRRRPPAEDDLGDLDGFGGLWPEEGRSARRGRGGRNSRGTARGADPLDDFDLDAGAARRGRRGSRGADDLYGRDDLDQLGAAGRRTARRARASRAAHDDDDLLDVPARGSGGSRQGASRRARRDPYDDPY